MPEDHQKYLEWNGDRFRKWAERIGPNTYQVINAILMPRVGQQSYKGCMGLLKLVDKHLVGRLEAGCEKALTYTATPSYKSTKNILTTGQDKALPNEKPSEHTHNSYGITIGAGYYGR